MLKVAIVLVSIGAVLILAGALIGGEFMMTTVVRLTRFQPPTTVGPLIEVIAETVTAVEHAWDPQATLTRSRLHLQGGEVLMLAESPSAVWDVLSGASPPLRVFGS